VALAVYSWAQRVDTLQLAVGVAGAAAADMAGAVDPVGGGGALDAQAGDDAWAYADSDLGDELALKQAELGGPGSGAGSDEEFSALKGHRMGVFGDVSTHQLSPLAEDRTGTDPVAPAAIGEHSRR
jgi:hypothetical protein